MWDPLHLLILILGLHDLMFSKFTMLIGLWKWGV